MAQMNDTANSALDDSMWARIDRKAKQALDKAKGLITDMNTFPVNTQAYDEEEMMAARAVKERKQEEEEGKQQGRVLGWAAQSQQDIMDQLRRQQAMELKKQARERAKANKAAKIPVTPSTHVATPRPTPIIRPSPARMKDVSVLLKNAQARNKEKKLSEAQLDQLYGTTDENQQNISVLSNISQNSNVSSLGPSQILLNFDEKDDIFDPDGELDLTQVDPFNNDASLIQFQKQNEQAAIIRQQEQQAKQPVTPEESARRKKYLLEVASEHHRKQAKQQELQKEQQAINDAAADKKRKEEQENRAYELYLLEQQSRKVPISRTPAKTGATPPVTVRPLPGLTPILRPPTPVHTIMEADEEGDDEEDDDDDDDAADSSFIVKSTTEEEEDVEDNTDALDQKQVELPLNNTVTTGHTILFDTTMLEPDETKANEMEAERLNRLEQVRLDQMEIEKNNREREQAALEQAEQDRVAQLKLEEEDRMREQQENVVTRRNRYINLIMYEVAHEVPGATNNETLQNIVRQMPINIEDMVNNNENFKRHLDVELAKYGLNPQNRSTQDKLGTLIATLYKMGSTNELRSLFHNRGALNVNNILNVNDTDIVHGVARNFYAKLNAPEIYRNIIIHNRLMSSEQKAQLIEPLKALDALQARLDNLDTSTNANKQRYINEYNDGLREMHRVIKTLPGNIQSSINEVFNHHHQTKAHAAKYEFENAVDTINKVHLLNLDNHNRPIDIEYAKFLKDLQVNLLHGNISVSQAMTQLNNLQNQANQTRINQEEEQRLNAIAAQEYMDQQRIAAIERDTERMSRTVNTGPNIPHIPLTVQGVDISSFLDVNGDTDHYPMRKRNPTAEDTKIYNNTMRAIHTYEEQRLLRGLGRALANDQKTDEDDNNNDDDEDDEDDLDPATTTKERQIDQMRVVIRDRLAALRDAPMPRDTAEEQKEESTVRNEISDMIALLIRSAPPSEALDQEINDMQTRLSMISTRRSETAARNAMVERAMRPVQPVLPIHQKLAPVIAAKAITLTDIQNRNEIPSPDLDENGVPDNFDLNTYDKVLNFVGAVPMTGLQWTGAPQIGQFISNKNHVVQNVSYYGMNKQTAMNWNSIKDRKDALGRFVNPHDAENQELDNLYEAMRMNITNDPHTREIKYLTDSYKHIANILQRDYGVLVNPNFNTMINGGATPINIIKAFMQFRNNVTQLANINPNTLYDDINPNLARLGLDTPLTFYQKNPKNLLPYHPPAVPNTGAAALARGAAARKPAVPGAIPGIVPVPPLHAAAAAYAAGNPIIPPIIAPLGPVPPPFIAPIVPPAPPARIYNHDEYPNAATLAARTIANRNRMRQHAQLVDSHGRINYGNRKDLRNPVELKPIQGSTKYYENIYMQQHGKIKQMDKGMYSVGKNGVIEFHIDNMNDLAKMKSVLKGKTGSLFEINKNTGKLFPIDLMNAKINRVYVWYPAGVTVGGALAIGRVRALIERDTPKLLPHVMTQNGNEKLLNHVHFFKDYDKKESPEMRRHNLQTMANWKNSFKNLTNEIVPQKDGNIGGGLNNRQSNRIINTPSNQNQTFHKLGNSHTIQFKNTDNNSHINKIPLEHHDLYRSSTNPFSVGLFPKNINNEPFNIAFSHHMSGINNSMHDMLDMQDTDYYPIKNKYHGND